MIFTVYGKVRGAQRPRITRKVSYTPKETQEYRKRVTDAYMAADGQDSYDHAGPLAVRVDIYRALPKSRPKRMESEPDIFKPDGDNVYKILDCLNGIAWEDDAQIVDLQVVKHPRTRREEYMTVCIWDKENLDY